MSGELPVDTTESSYAHLEEDGRGNVKRDTVNDDVVLEDLDNVDVSTMESAYVQPHKEVPNIGKKYSVGEDKAVESDDESSGFFDLPDMDDILEDLEEIGAAMKRVATAVAWCFDSSVDNFPIGGLVGLGITITSCMFMSAAMVQISFTIKNYDPSGIARQYLGYYVFAMIFFIGVHSAVFLHGLSTGILETQRECCGAKAGGSGAGCKCCCCKKRSPCAWFCVLLEKFAQKGCQLVWAIIGTVLLIVIYVIGLVLLLVSTLMTGATFGMTYSCGLFSDLVKQYISIVKDYMAIAKDALGQTDAMMSATLDKYQKWNNVQKQFSDSGVGQVSKVAGFGEPNFVSSTPQPQTSYRMLTPWRGRRLFDPEVEIENGRTIVSVLNQTIFESEAQLVYSEQQYTIVEQYCLDFASLYTAFYYILIASLFLLASELIVFAVHTKYFSAWNYEVQLMEMEQKIADLESKLNGEEDSPQKKGSSKDENNAAGEGKNGEEKGDGV